MSRDSLSRLSDRDLIHSLYQLVGNERGPALQRNPPPRGRPCRTVRAGRDATMSNLRLLCREHNILAAAQTYGRETMAQYARRE